MAMTSPQHRVGANAIGDTFVKIFVGQGVWNPASLANGTKIDEDLDLPGVALGDVIVAIGCSIDIGNLVLTAHVNEADVVTVTLANATGGAVDLASGTYRVVVGRIADFPENASA